MLNQNKGRGAPDRLLAQAHRLRLDGRPSAALQTLELLLSTAPGHVDGNLALADLLKTQGAQEQSLAALRRAADNAPPNHPVWTRYVYELRIADKKAQARKAADRARVVPPQRKVLRDIAEGRLVPVDDIARHIERGDVQLAWKIGQERLAHFPRDHRLLNLLGVAAMKDDDPIRAGTMLGRALEADPTSRAARANLGLALLHQGRPVDAIGVLEFSAEGFTASQEMKVNLASAYQKAGRLQDADRLSAELLQSMPTDPECLGVRCKTLISLGRAPEAVRLLRPLAAAKDFRLHDLLAEAMGEAEDYAAGAAYLATVPEQPRDDELRLVSLLGEWGELQAATTRTRRLSEKYPTDPKPFGLLSLFSRWDASDRLIGTMRAGLDSPSLPPLKRGLFGLALAKALTDTGRDDDAAKVLTTANGMLRGLYDYDVASDERSMQQIAEHWTPGRLAEMSTSMEGPAPIFIVGLPRSGSTLVETILSRHPDIQSLGESPVAYDIASTVRRPVTSSQVAEIAEALGPGLTPGPGKRHVTDKLLANFLNIGILAASFPRARFVEVQRDYRATCLSIYQANLGWAAHPYSTDLGDLARYVVAYDRLMDHWSRLLGPRLLRIDYRALVTSAEPEVRRILSELNVDWHPGCLRPEDASRRINTLSVGQARLPISTSSLDRWKRFEDMLAPLTGVLKTCGVS